MKGLNLNAKLIKTETAHSEPFSSYEIVANWIAEVKRRRTIIENAPRSENLKELLVKKQLKKSMKS